ncbi:hypothetical protein Hanom_Chr08g00701311 [Helianthus anomalus]
MLETLYWSCRFCPLISRRPMWRLASGDTCCPFCLLEHLWCHLQVFQKFLEASGFLC